MCSSKHHKKKEPQGCVQMYRAPFLYLPGAPNFQNPPLASLDSVAEVLYSSATVSVWDTQDPAVSIPHVSGIVEHFL